MVQNSTLGADQIMKKRVNFIYCYGPIQRKIPSQNQEKWQEFTYLIFFFQSKNKSKHRMANMSYFLPSGEKKWVIRRWERKEQGREKKVRGLRGKEVRGSEGWGRNGAHWRYKFDSSIYFRKDWKRSVILKVGTQLATTNQAYQVYWLTQQQFWS